MNTHFLFLFLPSRHGRARPTPLLMFSRILHLLLASLFGASVGLAQTPANKKILFFSKSSNFEHAVIKVKDGQPSFVENVLVQQGPRHGIFFTFSKDGSVFTPEYLAQFDAIMFYTSGDLLAPGKDGNPPLSAAGKAALLDAIRNGKGFVGVHSATDTFHTGETVDTDTKQARTWRYRNNGDKADPYVRMLGAEFIVHGVQQKTAATVVDPKFPGFAGAGKALDWMEEWYSFADFSPDLHVLLLTETSGMQGPPYQRPPYPSTWAHLYGQGRVFYTGLGHREDVWLNPIFQDLLFGGIAWAVRDVDADVTPNIDQVAPGHAQLPPVSAPVSGTPKKPAAK